MENNEESKIEVSSTGALTEVTERKPTSLETDELKGPVRQVKQSKYKVFKKYDIIYLGELDEDKHEKASFINSYREDGSQSEYLQYSKDGATNHFYYNDKELMVKLITNYAGGVLANFSNVTFNDAGKQLENKIYDANNTLICRDENIYDEKGKLLFENHFLSDETLGRRTSYLYNESGENIERKSIDEDGVAIDWMRLVLNSKGHTVEHQKLAVDGSIKEVHKFYDSYDIDGNPKPKDPNIKHIPYVTKESLYLAKTELDHRGNWIKKIKFFGELPIEAFVREITYYDNEDDQELTTKDPFFQLPFTLVNPITSPLAENEIIDMKVETKDESETKLSIEDAKWLVERSGSVDSFSALGYYALKFKEFPSQTVHGSQDIEAIALMEELKSNMNAIVLNSYLLTYSDREDRLIRYTLAFPDNPGYLLQALQIQHFDEDEYIVPAFIASHNQYISGVNISQMTLLHPSETSKNKDEFGFENDLQEYFEKCSLERIPDKPEIYMVEVNSKGEFSLQSHAVREDFEIEDLDVQYGYGFEHFHNNLMGRFKNESQGLVLFHGIPGTGKTYYIRHLLKEMSEANKIVIYMPPNMVDYLVDPGFMTFLSGTVTHYSENGNFCVLLIEDAEPLLAARHTETRIQGVTNLLNMTDGLLNDMLKLQIICTFNVELKQLDAALLRPGRLIARKEFKPLQELDANLLAQRLGIKYHFTKPATLSEIYAKMKNKNTLIHDDY